MEDHIDEQETEERLYDLYVVKCMNNGWTPSVSDYVIWKREEYPEEDLTLELMTEERAEEIGWDSERDAELELLDAIAELEAEQADE